MTARRNPTTPRPQLVDETLRDGLQSPSAKDPSIDQKVAVLRAMARVGVDVVSVGLPAVGERAAEEARALVRAIDREAMPLTPTAAARTVVKDIDDVARLVSDTGVGVEVYAFIGASPVRRLAEDWDVSFVLSQVTEAARAAHGHALRFCLVIEDTTRTHPELLRDLVAAAHDQGAARVCLCDTAGHATPHGARALVHFVRATLTSLGAEGLGLDWHAHNDRGLALATTLAAAEAGVDRLHGTALGIGERVGNAPLELLAQNLGLQGTRTPASEHELAAYVATAARALGWTVPRDHALQPLLRANSTAAPRDVERPSPSDAAAGASR